MVEFQRAGGRNRIARIRVHSVPSGDVARGRGELGPWDRCRLEVIAHGTCAERAPALTKFRAFVAEDVAPGRTEGHVPQRSAHRRRRLCSGKPLQCWRAVDDLEIEVRCVENRRGGCCNHRKNEGERDKEASKSYHTQLD